MSYINKYFNHVSEISKKVLDTQKDNIEQVGFLIANTIKDGNSIYIFGASHAGILAEELFYRTGGLALINPIFSSSLMLNTRPITHTSQMERLEGFGKELLKTTPIKENDVLIIHSVSGRNAVSIDMAIKAKEMGVKVVVITNMTYSTNVSARHSSGQNLYTYADILIDNCGDFEDSSMLLDGMNQKIAPTSTAIGAIIVNSIVISTVDNLLKLGIEPPVFHSANVDGGDEFNEVLLKENKDRIHYM